MEKNKQFLLFICYNYLYVDESDRPRIEATEECPKTQSRLSNRP